MKYSSKIGFILALIFILSFTKSFSITYYISNSGSDSDLGTSQANSWLTLNKVNSFVFQAGDSILFKRGDTWRGQLIPQSGDSLNSIYYGDYGTGEKPLLLGSVNLSDSSCWTNIGNNIWRTEPITTTGVEKIQNPSFTVNTNGWTLFGQNGANVTGSRDIAEYASTPASYKIDCSNSGVYFYDVQFNNEGTPFNITAGKVYKLTFKAKSSIPFQPNMVYIMQSVSPHSGYSYFSNTTPFLPSINNVWETHSVFLNTYATAPDAMLNFMFGDSLPDNSVLNIDDISLQEVVFNSEITNDVGNLIFNNASVFGEKMWDLGDVVSQGDFWFDADSFCVKMYSIANPANVYSEIECALTKNIIEISDTKYAIFENLDLRYGGGHAIGGANTQDLVIRACDISYIGGGALHTIEYGWVRYGNGIEFWGNAKNNIVEKCHIYQIYDAAVSNQNMWEPATQENIIYRNNLIRNSEYSYEYWNRPETSVTKNIYFINNTCIKAGYTWAHSQRPDKRGRHLAFYDNKAATNDFYVLNNIFYEATHNCLYVCHADNLDSLELNNNCYFQSSDTMIYIQIWCFWLQDFYLLNQFSNYPSTYQQDFNSIAEYPIFKDTANGDYRLAFNSPCIDAGDTIGIPISGNDFTGNIRVLDGDGNSSSIIDMGCYEYEFHVGVKDFNSNNTTIRVYPNPFQNYTTLEFDNPKHEKHTVNIYNYMGQEVKSIDNIYSNKIRINKENLRSGMYFLELRNNKTILGTEKIIIK